jgi:hypothetical protein
VRNNEEIRDTVRLRRLAEQLEDRIDLLLFGHVAVFCELDGEIAERSDFRW